MEDNKLAGKRLFPTHIYDYNYKVSEGYYKPQTKYMDSSMMERGGQPPPKHKSYAERFAADPWYGEVHGLPYRSEKSALNEPVIKLSNRPYRSSSLIREIRDHEVEDIPLNIRVNRRRKKFEEEDEKLGIRPRDLTKDIFNNERPPLPSQMRRKIQEKLRNIDSELERLAPKSPNGNTFNSKNYSTSFDLSDKNYTNGNHFPDLNGIDDIHFKSTTKINDFSNHSKPLKFHSEDDEDLFDNFPKCYNNKSEKIREERRYKQSKDISDGISGMVGRMRLSKINHEDGYLDRKDKGLRASTIDPVLRDEKNKSHVVLSYKRKMHRE